MVEKVKVDIDKCKGCYLCIANCKSKAISKINSQNVKGVLPVQVDQEKCIQCTCCYIMCPDLVFEIL